MAYFKNKDTGVTWHITNKDHIKRLRNDTGYLEVTNSNVQDDAETTHSEVVQASVLEVATEKVENTNFTEEQQERKRIEIEMMEWHELRKFASDNGVNINNKKRKQIEKELLKKLGDENVTD